MFTLGKVLISTRGLALGNYHFYMNAKPSVAMVQGEMCQCPLGLIPHFYMVSTTDTKGSVCHVSMPSRAYTSFLPYDEGSGFRKGIGVNALSGLYLISTVPLQKPRFYAVSRACFCRYLSEYSDNSRFSCMLTFWTYLMRCTSP